MTCSTWCYYIGITWVLLAKCDASNNPRLTLTTVVFRNPADFVGSVLGESEKNTKEILKATEGKVLIIDEAYMLYPGGKGGGNTADPYKTAVIDTIVAEVQSTPGEDRCVLLLGYKDQMAEMLENSNPASQDDSH